MPSQPAASPQQDDWLTLEQTAELLKIGVTTLTKVIAAGDIDVIRIGPGTRKKTWVTRAAVDDYIHRNTIKATANQPKRKRSP